MSEMHSFGAAKRVIRLQGMASEARFAQPEKDGIAHQQAARPEVADANTPPRVAHATTDLDRGNIDIDPWSWMMMSFLEGFALYGASLHDIAAVPVTPHPAATGVARPKENSFHTRRRHISVVSSSARPREWASEFRSCTDPNALGAGTPSTIDGPASPHGHAAVVLGQPNRWHWFTSCPRIVVTLWTHWRRERKIRKSVAALADLDDLTLRQMGIPDRSQIEQAVRYCHDC